MNRIICLLIMIILTTLSNSHFAHAEQSLDRNIRQQTPKLETMPVPNSRLVPKSVPMPSPILVPESMSGSIGTPIYIPMPTGNLTGHSPPDLSVKLESQQLTLSFIHSVGRPSRVPPACKQSSGLASDVSVVVKILETGESSSIQQVANSNKIVYQKVMKVPSNCRFSHTVQGFSPEKYKGYAWSASLSNHAVIPSWHRFIMSDYEFGLSETSFESEDICLRQSMVDDPTFQSQIPVWKTSGKTLNGWTPQTSNIPAGDGDNGGLNISFRNQVLITPLKRPIQAGTRYQMSFSMRIAEGNRPLQVRAYALTSNSPANLTPGNGVAVIDMTGKIPVNMNDWARYDLSPWIATGNFKYIALVVKEYGSDDSSSESLGVDLDKICFSEATSQSCGLSSDEPTHGFAQGVSLSEEEMIAFGGVETESELNLGSVSSLYSQYDTQTMDWMNDASKEGMFACSTLGDGDPNAEPVPDEFNAATESEWEEKGDAIDKELAQKGFNIELSPTTKAMTLMPIEPPRSGCEARLDPSKPFSGRDVVYVHGLRTAHLKENYSIEPRFQGKWPVDHLEFYSGGEFHRHAEDYWRLHITRGLESSFQPSNSYLVVAYSTNQRLEYGIHTVITQIRDAMNGNNRGVVLSSTSTKCPFGSNGIVIISHSTGGILVSSMLGIAELTKQPGKYFNRYGDLSFISNNTVAHISFNGAFNGSPLATAGLAAMTGASPLAVDVFRELTGISANGALQGTPGAETVLVDLVPKVSSTYWRKVYENSDVPTITAVSAIPGFSEDLKVTDTLQNQFGQLLMVGYDDSVTSASSQLARKKRKPTYLLRNPLKLYDLGNPFYKSLGMVLQGKRGVVGPSRRNFFVNPRIAPSGMIQSRSVKSIIDNPANTARNHFMVLQSTATHYDVATKLGHRGPARYSDVVSNIHNHEETAVVHHQEVYDKKLMNQDFAGLNQESRKQKTIGFHLPSISYKPWFKIRLRWKYYEFVIWRRHYHLLKGYQDKVAMDYIYEHALK